MSEWCQNRFEITGKSVCLDVLTQWIEGCETPRYRHAIQQSIQLFLAGCAGLVKPRSIRHIRRWFVTVQGCHLRLTRHLNSGWGCW